jgi:hypothetical protein
MSLAPSKIPESHVLPKTDLRTESLAAMDLLKKKLKQIVHTDNPESHNFPNADSEAAPLAIIDSLSKKTGRYCQELGCAC